MFIGFVPLSFLVSLFLCFFLIRLDKKAAEMGVLNLRSSAQTLHTKSISRFGGVAIYISTILTICLTYYLGFNWQDYDSIMVLLICLPAFLVGLLDDLKFNLSPPIRILLLLPVPVFFYYFSDIKVDDLDNFLKFEFFSLIFICFAIVGMMNAFNLIDGINGQLSSYLISIILALNLIENISGNTINLSIEFRYFTNVLLGSLIGFFILNLYGKIFLGDAGAYFLGAVVCFGLIYAQKTNGFSPWSVMLMLSYPFTDLVFSVLRRKLITGGNVMQPDAEHLHHIIYKRFKKIKFKRDRARHFFTILFLTIFNFPYISSAVYFADNTLALISIFIVYVLSYLLIYFSLSPRFLLRDDN